MAVLEADFTNGYVLARESMLHCTVCLFLVTVSLHRPPSLPDED